MDWPGIENGPPKNFKEFYVKNFKIYVLTEKKFWICFEEQLIILYRNSHNKYSEDGNSKFVRNVDIQVQDFEFSNPEEYQRYESTSKILT